MANMDDVLRCISWDVPLPCWFTTGYWMFSKDVMYENLCSPNLATPSDQRATPSDSSSTTQNLVHPTFRMNSGDWNSRSVNLDMQCWKTWLMSMSLFISYIYTLVGNQENWLQLSTDSGKPSSKKPGVDFPRFCCTLLNPPKPWRYLLSSRCVVSSWG